MSHTDVSAVLNSMKNAIESLRHVKSETDELYRELTDKVDREILAPAEARFKDAEKSLKNAELDFNNQSELYNNACLEVIKRKNTYTQSKIDLKNAQDTSSTKKEIRKKKYEEMSQALDAGTIAAEAMLKRHEEYIEELRN